MALNCEKKTYAENINSPLELDNSPESYRKSMLVNEVMVFNTWFGKTGYYVCPHCNITMYPLLMKCYLSLNSRCSILESCFLLIYNLIWNTNKQFQVKYEL